MIDDPIRFSVALIPFAIYVLMLGYINTRKRTVVLSGQTDFCLLAFGLSGFVLIGPLELLAPIDAFNAFGVVTWAMLICLFSLSVSLYVLISYPSLVLYNIQADRFQEVFTKILEDNQWSVEYAGTTISIPNLKIDFSFQAHKKTNTILLSPVSNSQNYDGWIRFSKAIHLGFKSAAEETTNEVRPANWSYYFISLVLFVIVGLSLFYNQENLAENLFEFLRYNPS